jgi:DNA-binding GntR family transcriptional regulator
MTSPQTPATPARSPKRALAQEIWTAISEGAYRPGEWLRQIDLEQRFAATRFDVRSALEELVLRHAIEHVPNRGYRVAETDIETLRAIKAARVILERATAAGIVANLDEPSLGRLSAMATEFGQAVRSGTRADQSRVNREFHQLLYRLCGNPILEELIWSLRDRARGAPLSVWASHQSLLRSEADHYEMLDALRQRDAARLAALIENHIQKDTP